MTPTNLQRGPQLRLLAVMERMPELAHPCDQIGEYPNCHHRAFILKLIEPGTEIHNQEPDGAQESRQREGEGIYGQKRSRS